MVSLHGGRFPAWVKNHSKLPLRGTSGWISMSSCPWAKGDGGHWHIGACHPLPKGPDSFILTKFSKHKLPQESVPPLQDQRPPPPREILDLPLEGNWARHTGLSHHAERTRHIVKVWPLVRFRWHWKVTFFRCKYPCGIILHLKYQHFISLFISLLFHFMACFFKN